MLRALLVATLLLPTFAMAQVYKCTEGGKTVYSDTPCPTAKRIDTDGNVYTDRPVSSYRSPAKISSPSTCSELSAEMYSAEPSSSSQSANEKRAATQRYAQLRRQYEEQCTSSEERAATREERLEKKIKTLERKQQILRQKQEEMQRD